MPTLAYLYKWTHILTQKWYVGSRSALGCHPGDGYLCSSLVVRPMLQEKPDEWVREILAIGEPEYIRDLEGNYLQALNAAADPMSFNKHNRSGKVVFKRGDSNPMRNPEIAKRNHAMTTGDAHWTKHLNGKPNPQIGQKRPSITGDNHPNKNPENAAKISKSHKGKRHTYMDGDSNVMRDPAIAAKLSGQHHWVNKEENKRTCEHCGIANISKSNYTKWHGEKCKYKGT